MFICEKERQIPVSFECDTVVCGGGIAGISAGLSAARCGKKVILIERMFGLGGLATLGLIAIYLPLCNGQGKQVSFGIAEELLHLSVKNGIEGDKLAESWLNNKPQKTERFEVSYNSNIFAIEAEKLLLENGVKLLYGTTLCDAITENGKITHIVIENKSGRSAVLATNFIDATGDADLCKLSGEGTVLFKQGNVPASWYYFTENGKTNLSMLGFSDIPDSMKTPEQLAEAKKSLRFGGLDAEEITELTVYSRAKLLADFLKNGKNSDTHSLTQIASIPQLRMTRRVDGRYTQDDCEMHKEYFDSVGMFSDWRKAGPVYELPFRCLQGKKISNLLSCGRIISSTDAMWDITRVIPVCAVSGEAVGTACGLFDSFENIDIQKLQNKLKENGVILHETDL